MPGLIAWLQISDQTTSRDMLWQKQPTLIPKVPVAQKLKYLSYQMQIRTTLKHLEVLPAPTPLGPLFVFLIITVAPNENGWYHCSLTKIISLAIRNVGSQSENKKDCSAKQSFCL